jgi:hypothetical protein
VKVKLDRRVITVLVVAGAAVAAVAFSRAGGAEPQPGLDDAASRACTEFAERRSRAGTTADRLVLADRITASSRRSDHDLIVQRVREVGRSAGDGDAAWRGSGDALITACRAAGWRAP